ACDIRLTQRWFDTAQLSQQSVARSVVQGTTSLDGALVETGNSLGDQRVVIGHWFSTPPVPSAHILLHFEGIAHEDCIFPLRTCSNQGKRATNHFSDSPYILYCRRWKLCKGSCTCRFLLPACDRFINRLNPSLGMFAGRQIVYDPIFEFVGDTYLYFRESV